MMITTPNAERAKGKGERVTPLGKDRVSAFILVGTGELHRIV